MLFLCVIVSQLKERRPRKTWKSRRWSSKKDEKEIVDALQFAQRNRESWQTGGVARAVAHRTECHFSDSDKTDVSCGNGDDDHSGIWQQKSFFTVRTLLAG